MFIFFWQFYSVLSKTFQGADSDFSEIQIFFSHILLLLSHGFRPLPQKIQFPIQLSQSPVFDFFFFLSFSFAFRENFSVGSSHHRCWFFLLLWCTDFNSEILSRVSNKTLSVQAAPILFLLLRQKLKVQALKSDSCLSIWASDCMCNFGQVNSI